MTTESAPRTRPADNRALYITGLVIDLLMVGLAVINLSWILFDTAWAIPELNQLMGTVVPASWLTGYTAIHERFFRIDLIFVSIFVVELLLRWIEAVWHRRYEHWLAYPILHWYDVLGCIPIAGFRWLRILRVFAILLRLQKLGIINFTNWAPYRFGKRIYDVLMEEISDRVVIRVLDGVQEELVASHNLQHSIIERVIAPRQERIASALRGRIVHIGQATYAATRDDLHTYITQAVSRAVHANREIKIIDRIPVIGGKAGELLDHAITDIVCRVIDELAERLSSQEFELLFNDICGAVFDALQEASSTPGDSDELTSAINDVLDVVKAQVAQRRWMQSSSQTPEN